MATLESLKRSAQRSTTFRGHSMRWGEPFGNAQTQVFGMRGVCRACGRDVWLNTHPAPNEIGIGGGALAIHCKGSAP